MEAIVQSLPLARIPKSHAASSSSLSPLFFHSNASSVAFRSATRNFPKGFLTGVRSKAKEKSGLGAIYDSEAESPPTAAADRWLLVPVGELHLPQINHL